MIIEEQLQEEIRFHIRRELYYVIQSILSHSEKNWDQREEIRANPLIVLEVLRDELDRRMKEQAEEGKNKMK